VSYELTIAMVFVVTD